MSKTYQIAVIPGDGIGPEVVAEGLKVLDCLSEVCSVGIERRKFDWGAEWYLRHGTYLPDDGIDTLRSFDAIYLGAVGDPRVPEEANHKLSFGIRRAFNQYANYRPVKLYPGVPTVFNDTGKPVNYVILRENTEGGYLNIGSRINAGTPDEVGLQTAVITRKGAERIIRYGFELARWRAGQQIRAEPQVTLCTKSGVLTHAMKTWDDAFADIGSQYPDIRCERRNIDALAMWLLKDPDKFDVVVCSNMFGGFMSYISALRQGGLGFAPSGSINPEREFPSGFEPMHGSAPKYTGKNSINPAAAIITVRIMLEHLGEYEAARLLDKSLEQSFAERVIMTRDMGGSMKTNEVGDVVCARIRSLS